MAWKTRKMISAAKTNDRPRGFTLIEIVMVLALAAVIMGSAIGIMAYSSDERALRKMSGAIELLAKQARSKAILQQTPYVLEFDEGGISLLPLAQAEDDTGKRSLKRATADGPRAENASDTDQLNLESDMKLGIRRWNSEVLLSTQKKAVHRWRFDPDGLCEPISIRLELESSWVEDTYHPLTAAIRDSQSETR